MKLTARRSCAALILLILAGVCAWLFLGYNNNRAAVFRYKHQLEKSGEKLSVDKLLPASPSLEQNSARLFRRAYSQLALSAGSSALETNSPPAMRMVAP